MPNAIENKSGLIIGHAALGYRGGAESNRSMMGIPSMFVQWAILEFVFWELMRLKSVSPCPARVHSPDYRTRNGKDF